MRHERKEDILLWVMNQPDRVVPFFLSGGATELFWCENDMAIALFNDLYEVR